MDDYKIAKIYDPILYIFINKLRKLIAGIIKKNNYEKILDVCCGTGNQMLHLQKNGIHSVGVDISLEMAEVAISRGLKCHIQDAQDMDSKDHSFDLTMTTLALHEKPRSLAEKIIEEMIRVTKPDGIIMIVDFDFNKKSFFMSKMVIDLIERSSGKEHYENFKEFIDYGGIDELVKKFPLTKKETYRYAFNSMTVKLYELN